MRGRIRANLDIILLVAIMFAMFFVVGVQAQITVATYTDPNCATSSDTFTTGVNVYGGADFGIGVATEIFKYEYPAGIATENTYTSTFLAGGFLCDSSGVFVGTTTGGWGLTVTAISAVITSSASTFFTVASSVPEFPLGVGYLILVILPLYVWLRKMRGRSGQVEEG